MPSEIEVIRAALKANPEAAEKIREMALAGKIKTLEELDPEEQLIVVATVNHYGITGCIQARCACGTTVWLSPATQAMLKDRGAAPTKIICTACLIAELKSQRERPNA